MVLKACLMEAGYTDDTRHTVDIDANWYSEDAPSVTQMTESLKTALENSGIRLHVNLFRMYGQGRSAGLELSDPDTGDVVDLYYLSRVIVFDKDTVLRTMEAGGRRLGDFSGFMKDSEALRHAYDKFRFAGDVSKPPFEDVYKAVKDYIHEVLPKER